MDTDKTGGAAFPSANHTHEKNLGMTILDYFAAKALEGALSAASGSSIVGDPSARPSVIRASYELAAAMLEERKKYIK